METEAVVIRAGDASEKEAMPLARSQAVYRTLIAKLHIEDGGKMSKLVTKALSLTITSFSEAVRKVLALMGEFSQIARDEGGVESVNLVIPSADLERARDNLAKPEKGPFGKSPRALAVPRYRNSYRLRETYEREGQTYLRFELVKRYPWNEEREGKITRRSALTAIPAEYLQQVIMSWVKPPVLKTVPRALRPGVCQEVAQQFLGHVDLLHGGTQPNVSYPTIEIRDPAERRAAWLSALLRVSRKLDPMPYRLAREIYPGKCAEGDPRGDRLVNADPDWREVVKSPFPYQFALRFVQSDDVVLYERTSEGMEPKRLYAALPILGDIAPDSPLGKLSGEPKLFWWRTHLNEFRPLPVWEEEKLKETSPILLVPISQKTAERVRPFLSDPETRKVNWATLRERTRRQSVRHGRKKAWKPFRGPMPKGAKVNWKMRDGVVMHRSQRQREWPETIYEIHFATSREVTPALLPYVLGIHFSDTPVVSWALADRDGAILEEGLLHGNDILDAGLHEKQNLETIQARLRSVHGRRFAEKLKEPTYAVARRILSLADEKNANLAVEKLSWVDKRGGGRDFNRRFSMWNYAELRKLIEWLGLERESAADGIRSIRTIEHVSDYLLRYTCPKCLACRKAKQKEEEAETWRKDDILHCRKCGFEGIVPHEAQARLVAAQGAKKLRELLRR